MKTILESDRKIQVIGTANDPFIAAQKISREVPDVIVLDVQMPKMDGIRVLKHVKKINPKIKVIIVTGYSTVGTAYRAIKTGASDYIPKPFDKNYILKAIDKVLKE